MATKNTPKADADLTPSTALDLKRTDDELVALWIEVGGTAKDIDLATRFARALGA